MTEDELTRLAALAAAATPGPWLYRGKSDSVHQAPWGPYQYGDQVFRFNDEEAPSDADCEFILAARDAVPALVAIAQAAHRVVNADNDRDQAAAIALLRSALDGGAA